MGYHRWETKSAEGDIEVSIGVKSGTEKESAELLRRVADSLEDIANKNKEENES